MSRKKNKKAEEAEAKRAEGSQAEDLASRIAELEATVLRAQADYKNLKRRSLAELEAGIQRSMQPLLEELMLVFDFLDMAMASPAEHPETKNLLMGIEMTRAKFQAALDGSDVREIPTNVPFDPAIHDATSTVETTEHEPGTIVSTVRKGYTWQGRVLRPAQVIVASAPGAPEDEQATPEDEQATPEDEQATPETEGDGETETDESQAAQAN